MVRKMREPVFLKEQRANRYAEHVELINRFVDGLVAPDAGLWAPHIAPYHGGRDARALLLLRDPGPMANDQAGLPGSGFLCVENDDPTAARLAGLMANTGLAPRATMGWNAYPWYINSAPTSRQLKDGVEVLARLLPHLTQLRVVILLGRDADKSWTLLTKTHPGLARGIEIVRTRHPSPRAFITTVPGQKDAWEAEQLEAFRRAAALIDDRPALPQVATEASVVEAFVTWLQRHGWDVRTEVDYADVVATRHGERLIAEAKGRTTECGLDSDTAYGQLLRRMARDRGPATRYAIVAPMSSKTALTRVPVDIRRLLSIDIYLVDSEGRISKEAS
jgi:hypothetical protein